MTYTAIPDATQMSAFMATVPDHVYFKDRELRFVSASLSLAKHYHCSLEDMLGKTSFDYYPEEQARIIFNDQMQVMTSGVPSIDHVVMDHWPDGRVAWFLCNIMPLRDASGEIVGIFGTDKDITLAKEMEQKLETANRELRDLSRAAGMAEIANNVLHNVGNVLNSVNVSAGLVTDMVRHSKLQGLSKAVGLINEHAADLGSYLTNDERGKVLPGYLNKLVPALTKEQEDIVRELESLTRGVEHIREIVTTQQAYAGKTKVIESVRLEDLIEDALRMNAGSIKRHHINIVKDLATLPPVLLDKHLMLQILINLIGNAKHAMDEVTDRPHQLTLRTRIRESESAPRLTISVADNGCGLAPENLARLFAHGYTTRANGHGFGLHSCALAAKELCGSIAAESAGVGQGAVFTLDLPLNPAKATP